MSKNKRDDQKHSLTSFQDDWITKFDWLKKVTNPQKAYCVVCTRTFDIGNGGFSALTSHEKGKTHIGLIEKKKENRIGTFFNKGSSGSSTTTAATTLSASASPDEIQVVSSPKPPPYVISEDVLEAEICWCLHMVQSHLSYSSCDPMAAVFKRMFKADPVAQGFQMKKDKARYLIIYGIFPSLKAQLVCIIKASPWFSVSFDESLNRHQQKCQMDVNIRYWDNEKHIAQSVYYDSKFLLRPNAENLKGAILDAIKELELRKFLHLAMDGPSTNWNVLDLINDHQVASGFSITISIGSYSLHILHGAFQTGITKSGWCLGQLLRALHKIFDESPARREVYIRVGSSDKFPLKFCATRWIEDQPVAIYSVHCEALDESVPIKATSEQQKF